MSSPPRSNAHGGTGARTPRKTLGLPTSPQLRGLNSSATGRRSPSHDASDRRETGRGALPGKSAHAGTSPTTAPSFADRRAAAGRLARRAEFPGPTLRIHPFTSKRFHVLLNSLFKVLFNFPSRYLSAIGLVSVFSLRWSLPPTLGCILKQPDSEDVLSRGGGRL